MSRDKLEIWKTKARNSGNWVIRWIDPDTGRSRQRSTGTTSVKEAERKLGELRADLTKGRFHAPNRITWTTFRQKYEAEVVPSLAIKTRSKINTVLDAVEDILGLTNLRELTAERISTFQASLRSRNFGRDDDRRLLGPFARRLAVGGRNGVSAGGPTNQTTKACQDVKSHEGPPDYGCRVSSHARQSGVDRRCGQCAILASLSARSLAFGTSFSGVARTVLGR
jgi:hypothetical protein